jgi:hypothetical protein
MHPTRSSDRTFDLRAQLLVIPDRCAATRHWIDPHLTPICLPFKKHAAERSARQMAQQPSDDSPAPASACCHVRFDYPEGTPAEPGW